MARGTYYHRWPSDTRVQPIVFTDPVLIKRIKDLKAAQGHRARSNAHAENFGSQQDPSDAR